MNKDLPMIKKEGIFTKIKKWFKKLFVKEEIVVEPVQEITKEDIQKIKENSFREGLKVKSKDVIMFLKRQLEENKIQLIDLTEEQLLELIDLYEIQIEEKDKIIEKNNKLISQYKNKKEE